MPGANILHIGAVRMRAVGAGTFHWFINDLAGDEIVIQPVILEATTARLLNKVTNYKSQYGRLRFEQTEIDEVFRINSIIIFVKPLYTDYPG